MMKAGIESISFYTPRYYLDLKTLAGMRGVDANKFCKGLGQEQMGIVPPDEDIVTMGAAAALRVLKDADRDSIALLIFATESGIDQSKSAAVYVHRLLGLSPACMAFEVKQACSSGTAGLLMALDYVRQHPDQRALVIAADVARYGLGTVGEPTQGAAAAAMLVSSNPRLLAIDPEAGFYSEDVMDFWRPNYREEALVDGKYSIKVYQHAVSGAWDHYSERSKRAFAAHDRFCYHLPFTRMAEKAHKQLMRHVREPYSAERFQEMVGPSLHYNPIVGNGYAAALYIGLTSLLEHDDDLNGRRTALFSYGSGCMAAFFSGIVQPGYQHYLHTDYHARLLDDRTELGAEEYEAMYQASLPRDGSTYYTPAYLTGPFRLAGIEAHKRIYEAKLVTTSGRRAGYQVKPAPSSAHRHAEQMAIA